MEEEEILGYGLDMDSIISNKGPNKIELNKMNKKNEEKENLENELKH